MKTTTEHHRAMIFFDSFSKWMTTSTSILGTAVATPALAGLASGELSWQQAILPLIGAVVAVAMPQTAAPRHPADTAAPGTAPVPVPLSPVAQINAHVQEIGALVEQVARIATMFGVPVAAPVSVALPAVLETMSAASARLDQVQAAVRGAAVSASSAPAPYVPV